MPLRPFGDEELRVVRVIGRLGHRDQAGAIVLQIDAELVFEIRQGRTAGPVAVRVASLNHEVVDDSMENQPVVETFAGELFDALGHARSQIVKRGDQHFAVAQHIKLQGTVAWSQRRRQPGRVAGDAHRVGQVVTVGIGAVDRQHQWRAAQDGLRRNAGEAGIIQRVAGQEQTLLQRFDRRDDAGRDPAPQIDGSPNASRSTRSHAPIPTRQP